MNAYRLLSKIALQTLTIFFVITGLGGCASVPADSLTTPGDEVAVPQISPVPAGDNNGVRRAGAAPATPSADSTADRTDVGTGGKVGQCNNELAALQKVNPRGYSRYRAAMTKLIASGRQYIAVQGGISQDINDILKPRYQFGMANLCWQIRSALSASLLESVNKIGDMDPRVSHDR